MKKLSFKLFAPLFANNHAKANHYYANELDKRTLNDYEQEVVRPVNEIRAEHGVGMFAVNTKLSQVARIKSQDMRTNGNFTQIGMGYVANGNYWTQQFIG